VSGAATSVLAFWFSDLESSTRLWEEHPEAMREALARHDSIMHQAVEGAGGHVVKTTGDGLMAVFSGTGEAVTAASRAQQQMIAAPWEETGPLKVRIGIHLGEAQPRAGDYFGPAVNRAARVMSAGHGGQVLLSGPVADAVRNRLGDGLSLRDLGEHRLKDLAGPEHLYQLSILGLPDVFPALATLDLRPNNLPTQTSVFLGRRQQLDELRALLDDERTRLVTLSGPGGTGKTRLALEAAVDQIDRFDDGLFFVDLSSETDAEGAFAAVMRTVGIEGRADAPALEALTSGLSDRHMMLVLDNFEQVVEAATGLAEVLRSCPRIRVVATSREALRLRGERLYPVAPLSLPPADAGAAAGVEAVLESEAVRLFVERAIEVRPDFEITEANAGAIAEICARVDGLPLAIELAAARLHLFSPEALRDRLGKRFDLLRGGARDLPDRQQTLRATLEWSYELLDEGERRLLQLFGVFAGARFEAVEAVAQRLEGLGSLDVIGSLESLVDKSLIRSIDAGGPWLSMLETIREYATERLAEDAELAEAAAGAHAEYYCELARRARPGLVGAGDASELDELARELGNLRAAWRYSAEQQDLEGLYDLLDTLWALHDARGWYRGIAELARELLDVLALGPQTPERVQEELALQTSVARALTAVRGYTAEVERAFTEALRLSADAGDAPKRFPVLRSLASLYALQYEAAKAVEIGREMQAIAAAESDPALKLEADLVVGANLAFSESIPRGLERVEEAVALFDAGAATATRFRLGPNPGVVATTTSAILLWLLGFPRRALERAAMAEETAQRLGHPYTSAYALHHVCLLYAQAQRFDLVAERSGDLLQVANTHDYPIWRAMAMVWRGMAALAAGQAEDGIQMLEHGMDLYQGETTPPVFWPTVLTIRAAGFAMAGRLTDALAIADEALTYYRAGDPGAIDAELLRGDLLVRMGKGGGEAREAYERALRLAREAEVRTPQLRAATRLARILAGTPEANGAIAALRDVFDHFTEGFDTPDLLEARRVLEGASE